MDEFTASFSEKQGGGLHPRGRYFYTRWGDRPQIFSITMVNTSQGRSLCRQSGRGVGATNGHSEADGTVVGCTRRVR